MCSFALSGIGIPRGVIGGGVTRFLAKWLPETVHATAKRGSRRSRTTESEVWVQIERTRVGSVGSGIQQSQMKMADATTAPEES